MTARQSPRPADSTDPWDQVQRLRPRRTLRSSLWRKVDAACYAMTGGAFIVFASSALSVLLGLLLLFYAVRVGMGRAYMVAGVTYAVPIFAIFYLVSH